MNEAHINAKASEIYTDLITATQEPAASEEKGKIKPSDLADEQILELSGRDFYDLDPARAYDETWIFTNQVFVGLTRQDPESLKFLPAMAKSWSVKDDGLTWEFQIQENVPWVTYNAESESIEQVTDEDEAVRYVTAEDIRAGLLRILDPQINSYAAFNLYSIAGAEDYIMSGGDLEAVGIEATSDTILTFHLNEPFGQFDAIAELPLFAAFPAWDTQMDEQPVFTDLSKYAYGPYVVKEYSEGESLVLVNNPFWKATDGVPEPMLEEIRFNLSTEQDVLADFKDGKLDAVQLTLDEYNQAKNDPELVDKFNIANGSCGYYLVFKNTDTVKMGNPNLRQAIAATIDKSKINNLIMAGTGQELNQFVPSFIRGSQDYKDEVGIPYDSEKADAILGTSVERTDQIIMVSTDSGIYNDIATSIEDDLNKKVGLNVVVSADSWTDYFNEVTTDSDYASMYPMGYCLDYSDAQSMWQIWGTSEFLYDAYSGNWHNQAFGEIIDQANAATNLSDREKFYGQAEKIVLNEDAVIVPLVWSSRIWLVRPDLYSDIQPLYQQLEDWAFVK
jgi:oligopeptide transport system substrate-binding protein